MSLPECAKVGALFKTALARVKPPCILHSSTPSQRLNTFLIAMSIPVVPTDSDLAAALVDLRAKNPSLGTSKLHTALLASRPEWTVSEKRTKKILQSEGLILVSGSSQTRDTSKADPPLPSSRVVEGLDVTQWTPKVEVKYFGKGKGKGLVAKERITSGETVWKEDPFILAPEWYDHCQCIVRRKFCFHGWSFQERWEDVRSALR